MAMTPIFANQVDLWLSILRNTSAVSPSLDLYRRLLALVVADAVTLMNLMVLTFLLCYCFARPAAGMCDCGKTLLVWFVLLLGFSASVVQTNIMSTWEVTVGISAAQVVAGVFLRWVVQRCG